MEATILHNHNYITQPRQNTTPTQWKQLYYTTITISQNQDKTQNSHNGSNYITQPELYRKNKTKHKTHTMEATILHNHNYITKPRQNTKLTQWKQLYYTTITISQKKTKHKTHIKEATILNNHNYT